MTDTERLIRSSRSPFARQLLEVGLRDDPSASSLRVVAKKLGLATGAGLTAGAVTGLALPAAAAQGAAGAAAPASAALVGGIVKWFVVGALAGSVAVGASSMVQHTFAGDGSVAQPTGKGLEAPHRTTSSRGGELQPRSPGPVLLERSPKLVQATPAAVLEPIPSAGTRSGTGHRARFVPGIEPSRSSDPELRKSQHTEQRAGALAHETAQIDAARRALEAGDLVGARAALDAYERERRIGLLNREALVLRIELVSRQGKTLEARALTQRLAESYPGDPHVARLLSRFSGSAAGIE